MANKDKLSVGAWDAGMPVCRHVSRLVCDLFAKRAGPKSGASAFSRVQSRPAAPSMRSPGQGKRVWGLSISGTFLGALAALTAPAQAQETCPTISVSNSAISLTGTQAAPCTITGGFNTVTVEQGASVSATSGSSMNIGVIRIGTGGNLTDSRNNKIINKGTIGREGVSVAISSHPWLSFTAGTPSLTEIENDGLIIGQILQAIGSTDQLGNFGYSLPTNITNNKDGIIRATNGQPVIWDTTQNNSDINMVIKNAGQIIGNMDLGNSPDLVINSGRIEGTIDFGGSGTRQGSYIARPGSVMVGTLVSRSSTTADGRMGATLSLSGLGQDSFDVSKIGALNAAGKTYQGFARFFKEDASIWTLTGSVDPAYRVPSFNFMPEWWVSGGRLAGDANAVGTWGIWFGGRHTGGTGGVPNGTADQIAAARALYSHVGDPDFAPVANGPAIFEFRQNANGTYGGAIRQCNTSEPAASGPCKTPIVGTIIKSGTGTLILDISNNANTYSGGTIIEAGVLSISGDGALGAASGTVSLTGGTLRTTETMSSARAVSVTGPSGVDVTTGTLTWTGVVSGTGTLTKSGAGALDLLAQNTLSGTLAVAQGTVNLKGAGSLAAASVNLTDSGTSLDMSGITGGSTSVGALSGVSGSTLALGTKALSIGSGDFAGNITGVGGSLTKTGAGTLRLSGANDYSGGTTVSGGTVALGTSDAPGSGVLTMADGTTLRVEAGMILGNSASFLGAATVDTGSFDLEMTGALSGQGALVKTGSGTLRLSGANTLGGTVVQEGTLIFGEASSLGTGAVTLSNGSTVQAATAGQTVNNPFVFLGDSTQAGLIDTQAFDLSLAGQISGTGWMRKTGAGRLSLGAEAGIAGIYLDAGSLDNRSMLALSDTLFMAGATNLENPDGAVIAAGSGIVGDSGVQQVSNAGHITGAVALGGGNDMFSLTATGTLDGAAQGGLGADTLSLDGFASDTGRQVTAAEFTGFETVWLNPAAGAAGTIRLAGDPGPGGMALFAADGPSLSEISLLSGTLGGNGRLGGSLSVAGGSVIAPGNSIGLIQTDGAYSQAGVFSAEYRVPALSGFVRRDGAFLGRSLADGTAGTLAEQDADLVQVTGTAEVTGGFVITQIGAAVPISAALGANENIMREVRYVLVSASGGFTAATPDQFIVLGDPDGDPFTYQTIERSGNDLVLVFSRGNGNGGTGGSAGVVAKAPAVAIGALLRPESADGCLPGRVLTDLAHDLGGTTCLWMGFAGSGGEAEISEDVTEQISESQIDFGAEMRFGTADAQQETRLGVFAGMRDTALTLDDPVWRGAQSDIETTRLGAYAILRRGKTDLTFSVIHGQHSVSTQRDALLGPQKLRGAFEATSLSLAMEATRWRQMQPNLDMGLTGGVSYSRARRDAYSETGSALENFSYDAAEDDAVWASLGIRARYRTEADVEKTGATDFSGLAGVETLLSGGDMDLSGSYAGNRSARLSSPGATRWDDTALRLELGLTREISRLTAVSAGVAGRVSSAGEDYSGFVGVKLRW